MDVETAEPDITLASTTETQAELEHATGPDWRKPFTPPAADAGDGKTGESADGQDNKKAETKTQAASDAAKPGAQEGKSDADDDAPLPKGVQKRIDRLTARMREQEEELSTLKKGTKPAAAAKPAAATDAEPEVKDFKTWEEWNAAHSRWVVRDENRKLEANNAEKAQAFEAKETYDSHLSRVKDFSTAHDDFEDVVREQPAFTFANQQSNQAFQLAIVEADNGPEIMYHLANNPEEMAKFTGLSPVKVQLLIGRMSAKLGGEPSSSEKTTPKTEPVSKTPAPTTPVRRSTAAPATRLDDPKMSTDDFIKMRNDQERNRRRH